LAGLDVLDAYANALKRLGQLGQLGELGKGGLKVLDDLGGDDARRRKVNRRSPNGQVLVEETNSGTPAGPAVTRWTRRRTAAQVSTGPHRLDVRKRSPKQ
jgi:hypothetical protein